MVVSLGPAARTQHHSHFSVDSALRHVGSPTCVSHSPAHHQRYVFDEAGNGVRRHVWSVTSYRATDTAGSNNHGPTSTGGRHGRGRELPTLRQVLKSSLDHQSFYVTLEHDEAESA